MKKIIMTVCAAVAMFTVVSCGNPAIKAGEEFLENPSEEKLEAIDKIGEDLSEAEEKEFEEWSQEHIQEFADAMRKIIEKEAERIERINKNINRSVEEEMGKAFK